jgi:ankyrin repeat protein
MVLDKGGKMEFKDGTTALETFAHFSMTKSERVAAFKTGASGMQAFGLKVPDWYSNLPDNINSDPVDMLELILSKGADINKPFNDGLTPLVTALRSNGKLHASKALMAKGADPKIVGIQTVGSIKIMHIPICHAAQQGDIELMEQMLAGGADINSNATSNSLIHADGTWGGNGYTPLNIALMAKNFSVAKLLIDKGADLKIGTNGYASMETTGNKGCQGVVEVKNKTAIYWAIESANMELIQLIADKSTWQYNPDFSYKAISGNCEGKAKLIPSSYAIRLDNKAASSYLASKGM